MALCARLVGAHRWRPPTVTNAVDALVITNLVDVREYLAQILDERVGDGGVGVNALGARYAIHG